jgi:hypothetical protein
MVVLVHQLSRTAVRADVSDDRGLLPLKVRGPVEPQLVVHDLAAEVTEHVGEVLEVVDVVAAGKRIRQIRGLETGPLTHQASIAVVVVAAGLDDGNHHRAGGP